MAKFGYGFGQEWNWNNPNITKWLKNGLSEAMMRIKYLKTYKEFKIEY
jgi:hypothetical protein